MLKVADFGTSRFLEIAAHAMLRPEHQRPEDEKIERALEELNTIDLSHTSRQPTSTLGVCLLVGPTVPGPRAVVLSAEPGQAARRNASP